MRLIELFEQTLMERLPMSIARRYTKMFNPDRYKDIFMKYPHDKNAYRIYLPYEEYSQPVPTDILNYLRDKNVDVLDYVKGTAKKHGDKRIFKIGSFLQDDPELLSKFSNDPKRQKKNVPQQQNIGKMLICISRHPYDIAGMSTNREWTSCMDLHGDKDQKEYVEQDVKHGTLVAYLIKENDKNITNPVARVLIKPFVSVENSNDVILYPEKKSYGNAPLSFREKIKKWCADLSTSSVDGLYFKRVELYNDDTKEYLHKGNREEAHQIETVFNDPDALQDIKNPSERVKIAAVKKNGYAIKYIENPSETIQIAAVSESGKSIQHIENPSENVKVAALTNDADAIVYIDPPYSKEVQVAAITSKPSLIEFFYKREDVQYEESQLAAVRHDGRLLRYCANPKPTRKVIVAAIKQNGKAIASVDDPDLDLQFMAVRKDGFAIDGISDPSEEVQMAAIEQDAYAISAIEHPTEKVQFAAIKKSPRVSARIGKTITYRAKWYSLKLNPMSIIDIYKPTEKMQLFSVKKNPKVFRFLNDREHNHFGTDPTDNVKLAAINGDGAMIKFVHNPTEEMQVSAIEQNVMNIQYIANPTPKVSKMVMASDNDEAKQYIENPIMRT